MIFNAIVPQLMKGKAWRIPALAALLLLSVRPLSLPALAKQANLGSSAPPVSGVNPLTTETDYTLGAGDSLRIDIFQAPDYSGQYLVLVDRTISLPLIGRIKVEGLTLEQASQLMSRLYAPYLKRPIVTVTLLAPRPLKLAISGEVNNPGSYTVKPDQKFPSVTEAIQLAGGLTASADVGQVEIRRIVQGKQQALRVNLWRLLQQGNLSPDVSLRDGDTIIIPTKDTIDAAETRQLSDASFGIKTDQDIKVAVIGEVNRPGSYLVKPSQPKQLPTLTQAIQVAGGIKSLADLRNIEVRRSTRNGDQKTIDVDLWQLLQTGNINEDVILQNGDTVTVPTAKEIKPTEAEVLASSSFSPATIRVNVVGEVKRPGVLELPPNTPLNQAILASGGFDERRADTSSVELIRLNPNGTAIRRNISVDFSGGIDENKNPTLRNNDVIVVDRSGLASATDTLGTVLSPLGSIFSIFGWAHWFGL